MPGWQHWVVRYARTVGGILLLIPLQLTLFAVWIAIWLGVGAAANLGWFVAVSDSPSALARSVGWSGRAASVVSWPLRAWGSVPFPRHTELRELGGQLGWVGGAATQLAPHLPNALGFEQPKRYLLAALNDAELFGSGGAPLELVLVEMNRARPAILTAGSAEGSFNPENTPFAWPRQTGLPWYREGALYPFANSNFHPDFRLSGANMASAWAALPQLPVDGVLTVDMSAVSNVLAATGPLTSGEYGELTADNLLSKVLVEAYRKYPGDASNEKRRAMNAQLRSDLADHLLSSSPLALLGAFAESVPSRHIQAWAVEPELQQVAINAGAAGELTTGAGDILGIFLQSGPSKLAIFQNRTINRQVVIAADGSAQVTQNVQFESDVPEGLEGDPNSIAGYTALLFRQRVAFRIPAAATDARVSAAGQGIVASGRTGPYDDGVAGQVLWQGQDIKPRDTATTKVTYSLPAGTFGSAGKLRYALTANPQALARPVKLHLEVQFPESSGGGDGWTAQGETTKWTGILDRPLELAVAGQ